MTAFAWLGFCRKPFLISLALFILALTGCAGSRVEITLKDLEPGLESFENDSTYDQVTGQCGYTTVDIPKYDKIFREAAMTHATVSQIRYSLEKLMGDSARFPKDDRSRQFGVAMLLMAKKQVPKLPGRIGTVVMQAKDLRPTSDFTGMAAIKAPSAAISLKDVITDMASSGKDIKRIAQLLMKPGGFKANIAGSEVPARKNKESNQQPSQEVSGNDIADSKSQQSQKVSVLWVHGGAPLTPEQLAFFRGRLSGGFENAGHTVVPTTTRMDSMFTTTSGGAKKKPNNDALARLGAELEVDHLVLGELVSMGGGYSLHLDFVDGASGQVRSGSDFDERGDLLGVYRKLIQDAVQTLPAKKPAKEEPVKEPEVAIESEIPVEPEIPVEQVIPMAGTESEPETPRASATPERVVPSEALPTVAETSMSSQRKVALWLIGSSVVGFGSGYFFDGQIDHYAADYDNAFVFNDQVAAYDNMERSRGYRNVAIGSASVLGFVGLVLWILD
jgi:hypothetical protein